MKLITAHSIALGIFLALVAVEAAPAQTLSARAAVDANSVFVGESVRFQIQVSGSETPTRPDLAAITDFTVNFNRGIVNSSSSITIINGRRTENRRKGYIFDYTLVPKREGRLSIPPITVSADGQSMKTQALSISAQKPVEADNFKLRLGLSKTETYPGEPLIAELVFYYNADVREPKLTPPDFGDDFHVYDLAQDQNRNNQAEQLEGKKFQTMRVRYAIVPKKAGEFPIRPATLAFQGVVGTRMGRDFFDRPVRQPTYQRFVVPSNEITLSVRELPAEGRPANFAGHVGDYQITASATPTDVNVGDPITLNIAVAGPSYLEHVELPRLQDQPSLSRNFKIPKERESGKVSGNFKLFTQTVRALNADVTEIPPIELAYFDTSAGTYKIAKSEPIGLTVKAAKVVTAGDAEGLAPVLGGTSEIQSWTRGIAHNYEDLDALENQRSDPSAWLKSPVMVALVGAPPVAYAALFGLLFATRKRLSDPAAARARKALGELSGQLDKAATNDDVLEATRAYLGAKLRRASGAITFNDLEGPLAERGVSPASIAGLKEIFDQCEASRYAGAGSGDDVAGLSGKALEVARKVEKEIR